MHVPEIIHHINEMLVFNSKQSTLLVFNSAYGVWGLLLLFLSFNVNGAKLA